MTDTETTTLTTAEIRLYREIVWWCRNHGVTRRHHSWGFMWREIGGGRRVAFDKRGGVIATAKTLDDSYRWHEITTLTQAVDVLVAYGYLPPRFSSAYGAGWDAAQAWFTGDPDAPADRALHRSLFGDPLNISFPVGDR